MTNSDEMKVQSQALVTFSKGYYNDQIFFDVVSMQASHILLGWPGQFDTDAQHQGKSNKYHLVKDGKPYTLAPLPPIEVCKFQLQHRKKQIE